MPPSKHHQFNDRIKDMKTAITAQKAATSLLVGAIALTAFITTSCSQDPKSEAAPTYSFIAGYP